MTVCKPLGTGIPKVPLTQEDTLYSEIPLQAGLCDLPTAWSRGEVLGRTYCNLLKFCSRQGKDGKTKTLSLRKTSLVLGCLTSGEAPSC